MLPAFGADKSYDSQESSARLLSASNGSTFNSMRDKYQSFRSVSSAHSTPDPTAAIATGLGLNSLSEKFSLPADPDEWGAPAAGVPEPDDWLHDPTAKDTTRPFAIDRGLMNLGCLIVLLVGLVTLFAGYPMVTYFTQKALDNQGGFNLGGINASGQIPSLANDFALIDTATPQDVYKKNSWNNGPDMELVFSDEFNTPGRTFWPGDDPYWEAVDLHYWATNNLEWYSPEAVTTKDGYLHITLSEKQTHGLNYQGGMISTWNKFCFTGGYVEASVSLPGVNNIVGLWPAVWAMGNLGRAGYGASLDGLWPYTYDACDVGTLQNQTMNGQPEAATVGGDTSHDGVLSYLPGQRLSRCTCQGESHPGPVHSDGSYVGRAAPEIDMFEAQISQGSGQVSQSSQWAPFNAGYEWFNTTDNLQIPNKDISVLNTYTGGVYQQAASVVTQTNQDCYELATGCFSIYGFEYKPGFDDAYVSWVANNELAYTIEAAGFAADSRVQISARPVSQEPMYLLANLGMSRNFGEVDLDHLTFPTSMRVDYIRVYQPSNAKNIGCDPPDFPTAAYIKAYAEAYNNPNLTTWVNDYKQSQPKNKLIDQC